MEEKGKSPSQVLAEQLPAVRARRQLSAQQLAAAVRKLGGTLDRAAISKIETGARGVSLDEAVMLAVALDVAPVHLLTSRDDHEQVSVAPAVTVPAARARRWVRGLEPLPGRDDKAYRTEVPASEWARQGERVREAEAAFETARRRLRVAKARLDALDEESARAGSFGFGAHPLAGLGVNRHVDMAYERIAEARVDLDDAEAKLRRVRAEARLGDGER